MAHKLHTFGQGPWAAYFELGSLQDGTKEVFVFRKRTRKAARIAAYAQAKIRNLPHVAVTRHGASVWCTCGCLKA